MWLVAREEERFRRWVAVLVVVVRLFLERLGSEVEIFGGFGAVERGVGVEVLRHSVLVDVRVVAHRWDGATRTWARREKREQKRGKQKRRERGDEGRLRSRTSVRHVLGRCQWRRRKGEHAERRLKDGEEAEEEARKEGKQEEVEKGRSS